MDATDPPRRLSLDELATLTGREKPSAQIRYLEREAIAHVVNAAGRPVVTWAAVDARMGTRFRARHAATFGSGMRRRLTRWSLERVANRMERIAKKWWAVKDLNLRPTD